MATPEYTPGRRPSRRDRLLVSALASGKPQRAAAKYAGCSLSTVQRRMRDRAFRRLLEEARGQILDEVLSRAVGYATKAVETLADIIDDPASRAAVRVSACRGLLDTVLKFKEMTELARRVDEIENALRESTASKEGI